MARNIGSNWIPLRRPHSLCYLIFSPKCPDHAQYISTPWYPLLSILCSRYLLLHSIFMFTRRIFCEKSDMIKAYKYISQKKKGPGSSASKRPCAHRSQWYQLDSAHGEESGSVDRPLSGSMQELNHVTDGENCSVCKEQKHNERVYRAKLIAGLTLPFILSTLDLTIVATATSSIASHFSKSGVLGVDWLQLMMCTL